MQQGCQFCDSTPCHQLIEKAHAHHAAKMQVDAVHSAFAETLTTMIVAVAAMCCCQAPDAVSMGSETTSQHKPSSKQY